MGHRAHNVGRRKISERRKYRKEENIGKKKILGVHAAQLHQSRTRTAHKAHSRASNAQHALMANTIAEISDVLTAIVGNYVAGEPDASVNEGVDGFLGVLAQGVLAFTANDAVANSANASAVAIGDLRAALAENVNVEAATNNANQKAAFLHDCLAKMFNTGSTDEEAVAAGDMVGNFAREFTIGACRFVFKRKAEKAAQEKARKEASKKRRDEAKAAREAKADEHRAISAAATVSETVPATQEAQEEVPATQEVVVIPETPPVVESTQVESTQVESTQPVSQ